MAKVKKTQKNPQMKHTKKDAQALVSPPYPGILPPRVQRTTECRVYNAFVIHHKLKSWMQKDRKDD